jgi:hypothetical protein
MNLESWSIRKYYDINALSEFFAYESVGKRLHFVPVRLSLTYRGSPDLHINRKNRTENPTEKRGSQESMETDTHDVREEIYANNP